MAYSATDAGHIYPTTTSAPLLPSNHRPRSLSPATGWLTSLSNRLAKHAFIATTTPAATATISTAMSRPQTVSQPTMIDITLTNNNASSAFTESFIRVGLGSAAAAASPLRPAAESHTARLGRRMARIPAVDPIAHIGGRSVSMTADLPTSSERRNESVAEVAVRRLVSITASLGDWQKKGREALGGFPRVSSPPLPPVDAMSSSPPPPALLDNSPGVEAASTTNRRAATTSPTSSIGIAVAATAGAATIESFYRSAMNHIINEKVRGVTRISDANLSLQALFPKMHMQIPTRVVFVFGLKELRFFFEDIDVERAMYGNVTSSSSFAASSSAAHTKGKASADKHPDQWRAFTVGSARLFLYTLPGLIMSPFCSLLEASSVSPLLNNEPLLTKRWRRGLAPRLIREAIFAVGINQAAERCGLYVANHNLRRRGDQVDTPLLLHSHQLTAIEKGMGSIIAGTLAGYASQIPHVLSSMRLMNPRTPYATLWEQLWMRRYEGLSSAVSVGRSGHWQGGAAAAAGEAATTPAARRLAHAVSSTNKSLFWTFCAPFLKHEHNRKVAAKMLTVIAPCGVVRRSLQLAGTCVLINGLTHYFRKALMPLAEGRVGAVCDDTKA